MYTKNLVSVITPNYNCGRFLAQTIKSVIAQSYTDWELFIVDDCSTDNSLQIAEKYAAKDSRIKIIRQAENQGAAVARNTAISLAQGEFIAFLDSDDIWLPQKLEKQISFMHEHGCDFSFTEYEHINEDNESLLKVAKVIKKLTYWRLLLHNFPGCLTVVYNQNVTGKVYAQDIKKDNDRALFLNVIQKCNKAMGIPECLALYRIRNGSISRNKFKMIQPFITVIHDFQGHSYIISYFCVFMHFFIKIFFKYRKIKKEQSACNGYLFNK